MAVTAAGFKVVNVTDVTINVQDHLEQNFTLVVGSVSESITVEGGAPLVDTESATVSTVVDRNFAENLPMNGRSFQTLIQLTPGVVVTTSNYADSGQFSINGQRASSNYWMVDGVSANIGTGAGSNPALGGSVGSFSVLGGTNSLVSVDAMQEFRIQTSTYAPEFGRTPGGQISIATRSGTNQFHGTTFDYLRNDVLDANNWFNGYINNPPLPKAEERQNDFGGTLGGPIITDRIFFFFSYEGLRLRLPQTTLSTVPDISSRQNALSAIQPYLNAFSLPNGPEVLGPQGNPTGAAAFNASYSNPASLDAYSLRIDHKINDRLALFGRYNYSPSEIDQRGSSTAYSLSTIAHSRITTQTGTVGAMLSISPIAFNDLRFNYSRVNASADYSTDEFGGAVPLSSSPFPDSYDSANAAFRFTILELTGSAIQEGLSNHNVQRQINIVDNFSIQTGSHNLKFGIDFRRLSPVYNPGSYDQFASFDDVSSAETGSLFYAQTFSTLSATFLFRNLGLFVQDTWHVVPRLTLTYGLRWDLDFVPSSISGPNFPALTGFNLANLSQLGLAPAGTPPYKTTHGNLAPRIGIAYQLSQNREWQTIVRGGIGIFYDLASSEFGNSIYFYAYPFGGNNLFYGPPLGNTIFPLTQATAAPPSISSVNPELAGVDPNLKLPYTLQWNCAVEQGLGKEQTLSASYIGSSGRRLLQTAFIYSPNPNLTWAQLVANTGMSNYNALQVQFQRRLSHGAQALASYTWSHSIDTGSAGSNAVVSNTLVPSSINANRGPSDFDIRNSFTAGVTFDIPAHERNSAAKVIFGGWSTENFVIVRSAPPVDISDGNFYQFDSGAVGDIRPDLVKGQPLYLYGSQCVQSPPAGFGQVCPGGRGFNINAFTDPPVDPNTGNPLRQGDLSRNALRGFGAVQWDFAVHRDFPIRAAVRLQFRAEMFNVLNHPDFGQPNGCFGPNCSSSTTFGLSYQMLGQSLNNGNVGGGGFSSLYQIGGPRSIQLALKLLF
jgi:hypothetical protein